MKTIVCTFKSDGQTVKLTAILTDDLTELSKSKKNQATDLITDFMAEEKEWTLYFDCEEKEKIKLGYELVFRAEDGKQTLKPIKAITWLADVIADVQHLKVTVK